MRSLGLVAGLVAAALIQIACDPDPAHSVKIPRGSRAETGGVEAEASALRNLESAANATDATSRLLWDAALCPPPLEPSGGPSTLTGRGACAFEQQGAARCILTDDDLLMEVTRPMPNDGQFMVYVSIENFWEDHDNDNGLIVVGVRSAQGLYRWATETARVRNGPDESFVVVNDAHLQAVPPMKAPEVVVSGTFKCGRIDRRP